MGRYRKGCTRVEFAYTHTHTHTHTYAHAHIHPYILSSV